MTTQPLLVFDSGLGGLSIIKEFLGCDIPLIYFADQANFPYGEKSESWLKSRLAELAEIWKSYNPLAVVLACNTGTVSGITIVRSLLVCPVFGVEPVAKMLSSATSPVIWGTKVTLDSQVAKDLRDTHGNHIRFYTPSGLPSAIEQGNKTSVMKILTLAKRELGEVDAIGLSCTHYPLIKTEIEKVFAGVTICDPSAAVAAHVIKSLNLINHQSSIINHKITFVSTKDMLRLKRIGEAFLYDNSTIFNQ
jgi:glutamate racemase